MKRHVLTGVILAGLSLPLMPLSAQDPASGMASVEQSVIARRADDVVRLLNAEIEPEAVLSDAFLAEISAPQFKGIAQQLTGQFGRAIAVESVVPSTGSQAQLVVRMERALALGNITIDTRGDRRVVGLYFHSFEGIDESPQTIRAELMALPGTVSAWFAPLDGANPTLAIAPQTSLALGSTFKLYVLAALAEDIASGRREWNDTVTLTVKSFPSGQMQDWPMGAPVTLHTLASLMISVSDNTATDQLIQVLGRGRIIRLMRDSGHADPAANIPFLNTRELFLLKGGDPSRLAAYRAGDAEQRAAILARIEDSVPTLDQLNALFGEGPQAIDIEWFASADDLVRLLRHMRRTADAEAFRIMGINPSASPSVAEKWAYIGYKGGSEPGVLNLTWLLTDRTGRDHVLVMTWNNPQSSVDETAFELIGQRVLSLAPR